MTDERKQLDLLIEALRLIADQDRVQTLSVARGIADVALSEHQRVAS